MNETALKSISGKLKTPFYVFDSDEFLKRAEKTREILGEKTGLCFSIKANPFLLKCLPECFDKIEVCSPGELTICEKTGVDMNKVIFSGVNKGRADVKRAMLDGVGVFTAESKLHLEMINEAALEEGKRVPLLLRLTGGSQFGMDESDIFDIIKSRESFKGVEIIGLHYFTGTQKRRAAAIIKELNLIDAFAQRIKDELGFEIKNIEYGTGLAADYFSENPEQDELARLEETAPAIRALAEKYAVTVEMGRFFAAPCGYYFTSVADTKTNAGVNYAILDGGLHQLKYDGQLQGMQIPQISCISENGGKLCADGEKWTLCGSLCSTADILARNVEFSSLSLGDTLVFKRTGAYSVTEGMANFLSRELPAVAIYSEKDGLCTVREMLNTDVFNTPN